MITILGSAIKQRKHFVTLSDICFIEKGKIGIQAAIPGEYPLVTTAAERSSHNEYHFEGEAVCIPLVSATGHGHASIKRIHFQKGKFCVGNILCACLPKDYDKISAKFLHLYLSLLKDTILVPLMQGSANVSLKIKDLEKVEVPDVSFERQLEIVDEFERLEVINNVLLKELDQQQTYLRLLRQSILQEAVQGKLTKQDPADEPATELLKRIKKEKEKRVKEGKGKKEKELPPIGEDEIPFVLPVGWVWCRLRELGFITGGGTPSTSNATYWNGSIPWITPKDMKANFLSDAEDRVTIEGVNNSSAKLIPPNSILVVGRSGILKRTLPVCINTVECVVNQDLKVIVPYVKDMTRYIQLMLQGHEEFILQKLIKYGMTVHSLMYQEFEIQPFPLPPLPEQQRIVDKVQQLQQQIQELETQAQQSRAYAQQLLQSVLMEAFGGNKREYEENEDEMSMVAESGNDFYKQS